MMGKPVYLNYDAAELDIQYDNRRAVPGCTTYFEEWTRRSADFRQSATCRIDVPYGRGERETLDIFLPRESRGPLHVFVHGGYWRALDKSFFSYLAAPLVDAGAAVALINYPLCPAARIGDCIAAARKGLAWLYREAASLGANPREIHLSGHSAGGHLVAMLMATHWPDFSADLPHDLIHSAVAISGVYDLEPLPLVSVNQDLRLTADDVQAYSPILLEPAVDASLTVFAGGAELREFVRQSKDFVTAWKVHNSRIDYIELAGHDHFSIVDRLNRQDDPITRRLLENMHLSRPN